MARGHKGGLLPLRKIYLLVNSHYLCTRTRTRTHLLPTALPLLGASIPNSSFTHPAACPPKSFTHHNLMPSRQTLTAAGTLTRRTTKSCVKTPFAPPPTTQTTTHLTDHLLPACPSLQPAH